MASPLGEAIIKLSLNADQLKAELKGISAEITSFTGVAGSLKRILETATGVSFANLLGQLKDLTVESLKMAQAERLAAFAFEDMATKAGVSSAKLLQSLRQASGQTSSLSDSLKEASLGLQQGLAPEQLTRLMEIARSQSVRTGQDVSEAFNDLTRAVALGNERFLKQMGIVVDVEKAMRKYAESLGVDATMLTELGKAQATYNAVAEATKTGLIDTTSEVVKQKEAWERLKAEVNDFRTTAAGGLKDILGQLWEKLKQGNQALSDFFNRFDVFNSREFLAFSRGGNVLPEEGVSLAGAPPGAAGFAPMQRGDVVDQEKLQRLNAHIAAQRELQRVLGATAIAEAALSIAEARNELDAISAGQARIAIIEQQAAAQLRANAAERAIEPLKEKQAELDRQRAEIIAKRQVAELEQIALMTKAWEEYFNALKRGANQVEGAINLGAIKRMDDFLEAVDRAKSMADLAPLGRGAAQEALAFSFPTTDEGHSMSQAWRDAGQALTEYYKAADATDRLTQNLGTDFDTLSYRVDNLRQIIEQLSKLDPTNKALEGFKSQYQTLTTIQTNVGTIFDSLQRAVSGTVSGLLQGTLTVAQAFQNMGRNIAASLIENVINRGLKVIEREVEKFLMQLTESGWVQTLAKYGLSFGSASVGTGAGAAPALSASEAADIAAIPYFQHGGIVRRPTLGLVGEAGPEAIVPLTGHGGIGETTINVYNQAPNTDVTAKSKTTPDGRVIHDIVVREVKRLIGTGEFDPIMAPYALRRVPTQR